MGAVSVGITFLCVVFAWVFFRAPSFSVAYEVVQGMVGINGFVLPTDYQGYLGFLGDWLASHGWQFQGDVGAFSGKEQVLWLVVCFGIIWSLPNTQQIFADYDPGLGFIDTEHRPRIFVWRPRLSHALAIAVLSTAALLSLNRVSEFLYFQF